MIDFHMVEDIEQCTLTRRTLLTQSHSLLTHSHHLLTTPNSLTPTVNNYLGTIMGKIHRKEQEEWQGRDNLLKQKELAHLRSKLVKYSK